MPLIIVLPLISNIKTTLSQFYISYHGCSLYDFSHGAGIWLRGTLERSDILPQNIGKPLDGLRFPHPHRAGYTAPLVVVEGLGHGQEAPLGDRGQGNSCICSVELVAIHIGCVQNPD